MTPYRFLYNLNDIDLTKEVSVSAEEEPLYRVLNRLFKDTDISYKLVNNQIVLNTFLPKPASVQQQISGVVSDENGMRLLGVTVLIKGSNRGTTTDMDGRYRISADAEDVLVFSFVGFESREVVLSDISASDNVDVVLKESADELAEVIVTGYNNIVQKRMTGAVNTIKTADVYSNDQNRIDNMLKGQVPGLSITSISGEVGSVPMVKIRGTSTLTGNTSPLWVVDGVVLEDPVPLTPTELNTPDVVNRIGNALSGINPQDIETITVLKDASATAIYGVRAAGGVIVLTTKRGRESKPVVNFSIRTSVAERPRYSDFNLMNSKERIGIEQYYFDSGMQYYNADANVNSVGLSGAYARYKSRELATWSDFQEEVRKAQTYNTDWFDILFRDALSVNANVNVSGGSEKTTYYASLGMVDEDGTDIMTDNKRFNGSIKLNTQLSDAFNVELYLSTYRNKRSSYPFSMVPPGISNFTRPTPRPFDYAINTSRTFPLKNPDGSYYMYRGHNDFYLFNIMNEYDNSNQTSTTDGVNSRISVDVDITDNLKVFGLANYTRSSALNETYYKENTNQVAGIRRSNYGEPAPGDSNLPSGGIIFSNSNFQDYIILKGTFDYTPLSTDLHYVNLYGGGEYRSNNYRGDNTIGYGYLHERGKVISTHENIGEELSGAPYLTIRDYSTKSASYFGVATYSFKDKYVANLNIRYDGSNLFGSNPKYRWSPAWSIAGRWNIMEESFMKEGLFDNLAIRASYGLQGSTNTQSTPQIVASFLSPASWSGLNLLTIGSPANPNLTWEKTYNTNLGLDFAVFDSRVQGSVDVYSKQGKDLITNTRISEVNGFSTLPINFADVSNKGIEFGISTYNFRAPHPGFNWSTTVNFSYNKNEVTKVNIDPVVSRMLSPFPYKPDAAMVGKPLNAIYSVAFDHLDENGTAHFKLADGTVTEGTRDLDFEVEDLVYNGPMEAPYQGGISNMFEYHNFQLTFLFTYGFGNYFRRQDILESWMYSPDQNLNRELLGAWRTRGDEANTNIPHIKNETGADNHKYYWDMSDIRVIKGDYLRLSNVTLQYRFPKTWLETFRFSNAFIQFEGNNLFLFADKGLNGYDPETFPRQSLPIPRSYSLSINVTF
ncbi:SusC/RagA family TonB-linked outer membrane protein [Sinomicrobium soli]|uniref:SusC/RagA family TonB-linked outer membrane protein n=1 Tax=Sinomicrobium sp. N-1-3-6 TaxID=2219864 RepID=UPI001374BACF|nr:SusC/RagA family TonB-linked outer membrane protein [Sinomicrobium sp. N-1-3-6]